MTFPWPCNDSPMGQKPASNSAGVEKAGKGLLYLCPFITSHTFAFWKNYMSNKVLSWKIKHTSRTLGS